MSETLTHPDNAIWKKAYSIAQEDGKEALLDAIPPQNRDYLLKLLRQVNAEVLDGKKTVRDIHQIRTAHLCVDYTSAKSGRKERSLEIFQVAGPLDRFGTFVPDQFFAFDEEDRRKQFKMSNVFGAHEEETGEVIKDFSAYLLDRVMVEL